jgi:hypothetical protein
MLQRTQMLRRTKATTNTDATTNNATTDTCYNERMPQQTQMLHEQCYNEVLQRTMLQRTNATTNSFYQQN